MILKYDDFNLTLKSKKGRNSYKSKFSENIHYFYDIIVGGKVVGDLEYSNVDENTFEIISIFIDNNYRGKNYAYLSIIELSKEIEKYNVILWSAESSRKYWIKQGFKSFKNEEDYYIKELI